MSRRLLVVLVTLAAVVGACDDEPGRPRTGPTTPTPPVVDGVDRPPHVIAVLEADGRFRILLRMIRQDAPSFLQSMQGPDWDMTLFAPTDEAFESLPPERFEDLRGDAAALTLLLERHIVGRIVPGEELVELQAVETLAGPVEIGREGDKLTFGGATIEEPDIPASNGIIHAVEELALS